MSTTANQPLDDKALRKAWLKRKFASWEYHEELLKLHDEYLSALHRHWSDEGRQKRHPGMYQTMVTPVFFNFDKVSKPGTVARSDWGKKKSAGEANAIAYNFNRGLGDFGTEFDEWMELPQPERDRYNALVAQMLTHCENITYTVELDYVSRRKGTDDVILDEEITGAITWPTDWRDDMLGSGGTALTAADAPRVKGGEAASQDGLWQALDPSNQQRRVRSGETLPNLNSPYGITIWQHVGE
jgi:hypothetical protein